MTNEPHLVQERSRLKITNALNIHTQTNVEFVPFDFSFVPLHAILLPSTSLHCNIYYKYMYEFSIRN